MSIYRDFQIVPKRDFGGQGWLIKGEWVKTGFVVVRDGANVMPAAAWFQTTSEAKHAIDALILAQGDAELFWLIMGNSGGSTVETGPGAGRVTVEPCEAVVYYGQGGILLYDRSFDPKTALALASALRRAAMYKLGDIRC